MSCAPRYAKEKPYRDWIAEETLTVDALDRPAAATPAEDAEVPAAVRMAKLGYHWDDVDEVVRPMAQPGQGTARLDGHRCAAGLPVQEDTLVL